MKLHELNATEANSKSRLRVGRGPSSGRGKTSGRGHKGQKARSGGGTRLGFEGGQLPLFQRIPKRGFTNVNKKDFAIVNVQALNRFENDTEITPELLLEEGVVSKLKSGVKVLGKGAIEKKLTVKAHKFSASAKEAIEAAGGQTEVI